MTTVQAIPSRTRPGRVTPTASLALLMGLLACEPKPEDQPTTVPTAAPTCEGAEALDRVWTPSRRSELQAALGTQTGEWPTQMLSTIDALMNEQREPWRDAYARACTRQDAPAQRCLDRKAWEVDGVLAILLEDPNLAIMLWTEVPTLLAGLDGCAGAREPIYDVPPLRPELGRDLVRMGLLLHLDGKVSVDETLRALELVEIITATPGYAMPVYATKAVVAFKAGDPSTAASALATATTLGEQLGPRARTSLAHVRAVMAFGRGEVEAGVAALDEALVAAREQSDPWMLLSTLRNVADVRGEMGDHAGAAALFTEAIALSTRLAGTENPLTADVQVSLALTLLELGQLEPAHDLLTQARDSFVATLGPDHPQTLAAVNAIALVLVEAGRPFEANHALLDLLEVYNDIYGPKDVHTVQIKLELGDTLMAMDEHQSARTMYLEALPPLVQALGADHRNVIRCVVHLGIAEFALGNLDEAETHCKRGSDLVKALPIDDPLVAEVSRCVEQLATARKKKRSR